jgi:hypothetical protein
MGRTVRFDHIFVSNMDADPTEQDILTTVRSIITSEIEADEIVVDRIGIANTAPTKSFSIGADLFMQSGQEVILDVSKTVKTARMNVTDKIGVKTTNPLHDFQVGDNQEFFIGVGNRDLVTINGNVLASNLILTNQLELADKVKINNSDSNVLEVTGNTFTTNATVGSFLSVGNELDPDTDSNVAVFENGNVVVKNGVLRIFGNTEMVGNLSITEIPDYLEVNSLVISNAVIQMATDPTNTGAFAGNDGNYDMAMLMVQNAGDANVFFGYTQSDDTMKLGRTFGGPLTQSFTIDPATTTNLQIFGELYTQNNVGIANTSPEYSLSIGSNVYVNDTATSSANVLYANGYGYFKGMRIGDDGLTVGSLITLDADAAIPMVVTSTIQAHSIQTTGNAPTGIANTNPTDTFSVGDEFFVNTASTAANTLTILGNTVTNRLITQSIRVQDFIEVEGDSGITSTANVLIHADTDDGDTLSNAVVIKSGPLTANISAIEIYGAKTSASSQNIRFFTKNTERVRFASNGNVGIANTSPTDKLTVGGTVRVIGSNAFTMGTETNYMKAFSDVIGTQTKIESRVGTGKGLNFYASTTDTMGVPKMTILETSNVGIGVTNPQGRLHVSGGSAFMNTPISDGYNHLTTPLVVTNTTGITSITDARPVLDLSRNATGSKAVRATFKLGKYQFSGTTSKSKLDIYLSDANYADEVDVMTLQADGRVGIGSTQPSAFLEVIADGTGNPRTNGIMVHNIHGTGYGDAIMTSRTDNEIGNAFASHIQTNNGNFDSRRGWSTGVTGSTGDYRITSNVDAVSDVASTAIYINGLTRDVGIGTDAPRAKLEVNGNVVIGNELYFGGLVSDEFSNTFIKERLVSTDISELLIFKGNEGPGGQGPDQLRFVGSQQVFQTYSEPQLNDVSKSAMEAGTSNLLKPTMFLSAQGKVLIGTTDETKIQQTATTQLFVNGGIEFAGGQKVNFGNLDIFALSDGARFETTGAVDMRFQNKATAGTSELNATEAIRIKNTGLVGIGTNAPDTNVHIYSGVTTDLDMLKLESPGTNKKTGISLNTNDNYGGYVRGFSNTQHSIHGTVLGAVKNSVEVDGIHIIDSGNVGIGTVNPSEHFTVYGGTTRIEHPTSNAVLEFKTTSGISNIYGDVSGNVYIDPYSNEMIINSNLEITGDLSIDGKIDLGNQVAVDLGEATANTALHVGGGFISGSNEVACKRYSKTFSIATTEGQDVQITFQPQTFYAKIVAQLRETSDVDNVSTMILEVQGGTHDGTAPSVDIAIGTKNMFSGLNLYPWSPTVVTGKRSVQIAPNIADGKFYPSGVSTGQTGRNYTYDIFVEVVSGVGGGVKHFTHNIGNSPSVTLDNGGGGNTNLSGSGFEYTY